MPKLLENLPRQLLEEAAAQIARQGYAKTTVRSVASACGVAVGTVYNYFPSKEQLIAAFVAADWQKALAAMQPAQGDGAEDCLRRIYEQLRAFTQKHNALFTDPDAARAAAGVMLFRHLQLREQLACIVAPYFPGPDGFPARFAAEALLTWTISNEPFERIYEQIAKLIPNSKEDAYEQL